MSAASFVMKLEIVAVESFPWGELRWLMNDRLSPGAEQTLGLCRILPGQTNPRHYHPNC